MVMYNYKFQCLLSLFHLNLTPFFFLLYIFIHVEIGSHFVFLLLNVYFTLLATFSSSYNLRASCFVL